MPKIYVHTAFNLQHGGEKHFFPIGNHTVAADIASHWYTKAHTGDEPQGDPDTSAAADAMIAELEAQEKALVARTGDLDARAAVLDKQEADIQAREDAVGKSEAAAGERDKALDARQAELDGREQALAAREQSQQNAGGTEAKGTSKGNK
ncbi:MULTISPECIES: hypothetical protein [unclassified Achromobacter]|uniref:STY1053 family phage-associated protein n=1 Tax=unclassified Achromobacter TaxID=2626865 RepID=UPI0018E920B4|nr:MULTISPECIES: hypothetical protein [unclassified Achromobacter]